MSKKKRFSVSADLQQGLSETISVVENNPPQYRSAIIPLSRIKLDPENPRDLSVSLENIRLGTTSDDLLSKQAKDELASLNELAISIKNNGLLNPILVINKSDYYQVVAGERRTLASILAGKEDIEARIYNTIPSPLELKIIQWAENVSREDLCLYDRLQNIIAITDTYKQQNDGKIISSRMLEQLIGISKTQSADYLRIISGPDDLISAIKNRQVNSLKKACWIVNVDDAGIRKHLLIATSKGASLAELKKITAQLVSEQPKDKKTSTKMAARNKVTIQPSPVAAQFIFEAVLTNLGDARELFEEQPIDWASGDSLKNSFKKLIEILEQKLTEAK